MQPVSDLLARVLNRWTSSFAGIAVASLLVWYLGPLVPGLRGTLPRAALILAVVVIWAGLNAVITWMRRRRESALAVGVTESDESDAKADAAEEVSRLRAGMNAALTRLRGNRRRVYLYELPWFVLIGPPGAGKTTALLNSGLNFPLAQEDGADAAVGGVGGTRLCDWWFADEAVLIDTAGRYTTQDSDAAIDRAGWHGFLDLLRRTRPRQPINGVIVVISITDIVAAEDDGRTAHARAVRRRVDEISDRLRLRVPVYVIFTKADRLPGFNEFFDDLDAETRGQVWGMTFSLSKGVESFAQEFRLLLERLDARLFERLQTERGPDRRVLIAGFPLQAASLAQPLAEFLGHAFRGTKLAPAPFLRGVYISSATQEGTPIDQLTGLLARSFGIDQKRMPSLRPVAGRGYFLKRLISDVVLGEALLARTRSGWSHRRRWIRIAGFAATGIATLAAAALLWGINASNQNAVTQTTAALAAYRTQLAAVKLDPISDDDLPDIVPLLDSAADLPHDEDSRLTRIPGLDQRPKLAQVDHLVYAQALQQILLPRLIWRLEQEMRARFGDPDFLYEATRVYLMLGGVGPLDQSLVESWEMLDWQARFPGDLNAPLRDQLATHLAALLAQPLPTVTLDGALVGAARVTFSRVALAERIYSRIKADAASSATQAWAPADALRYGGASLFLRPSEAPLSDGVPGFYTPEGYRTDFLGGLAATTRAVADESWVLGRAQSVPAEGPAADALEHAVVTLYVADYERQWDRLLGDLALAPLGEHDETVRRLYVLSSPQSPIRDLLTAIVDEVTLCRNCGPDNRVKPSRLAAIVAPAEAAGSQPYWATTALAQHFAGLHALVENGQPSAALIGLLHLIDGLQTELAQSSGSSDVPATLQSAGDPVTLLLAEAQRQPPPVSGWLRQIADGGQTALNGNASSAASIAFASNTGPGELCRQVVTAHYPFDPSSASDAPLDDFARLFAPNGLLDSFFQTQLAAYVDTRGPVWRLHSVGGVAPPISATTLTSFQRAAAIRDAFFPAGGSEPRIHLSLTPQSLGAGSKRAVLTLNGTVITDTGQGDPPMTVTWPATGAAQADLTFDPPPPTPAMKQTGDWALFRILDDGRVSRAGSPADYALTFEAGSRQASFSLDAGSDRNPFGHNLLEGFQCPVIP
jgi:type VI secretion system protein ImpL